MKAIILYICVCAAIAKNITYKRGVYPYVLHYPGLTSSKESTPHSIPYQAELFTLKIGGNSERCAGSLISSRHVLTAAHCLIGVIRSYVYLGAHDLKNIGDSVVVVLSHKFIVHEEYNKISKKNDIGIVELDEPVSFNKFISAVALPSKKDKNDYEGKNVRASGWGRISGGGPHSNVLLEVNSTVISNAECKLELPLVTEFQLCISGRRGAGGCYGDSGGPLIADNVQIGIAIYVAPRCPLGSPTAFTRVICYLDWIEKKTGLKF